MITGGSWRAGAYLVLNRLALPGFALALLIIIGRVSGRLLGEYAVVTSFYLLMQTLPFLGLTPFVMREVARAPDKAGDWFASIAVVAMGGCVLVDAAVLAAVPWLHYAPAVQQGIAIVGVSIAPGILAYLAEIVLVSIGRAGQIAIVPLVENAFRLAASAFLLMRGGGIVALMLALLAGRTAAFGAYLVMLLRLPGFRPRVRAAILRMTGQVFPPFLLSGVLTVVIGRLDFIVLSIVAPVEQVGYYGIAYRTYEIAMTASAAALTGFFPEFARRFHAGSALYMSQVLTLLPALLTAFFPLALIAYVLAPAYVRILFPHQYPAPAPLAGAFCLLSILGWTDQFLSNGLNACDRQRADAGAMAVGAGVFVVALLALAPRLWGQGAFLAMALALGAQSSLRFLALRRAGAAVPGAALLRALALGVPLALGVIVLSAGHPLIAVALALAAGLTFGPKAMERLGFGGAQARLPRLAHAMVNRIRR